jgi:hypothetical protein
MKEHLSKHIVHKVHSKVVKTIFYIKGFYFIKQMKKALTSASLHVAQLLQKSA